MLSGDNGILQQAADAKEQTGIAQEKEQIQLEVMGSYETNGSLKVGTVDTNIKNHISGVTTNGASEFPLTVTYTETNHTYIVGSNGNVEEAQDRTGIKVGDYITYISPTVSTTLTKDETGVSSYSGQPYLIRQTLFRVLDIKSDGSMVLIGTMTRSDDPLPPAWCIPGNDSISICGAQGYNNGVYTLNKKCSELYGNEKKGITSRSIQIEDITDRFNNTGNAKITNYIDTCLTDMSNKIGTLGNTSNATINLENKTVMYTFTGENGRYPDLFQYESGGKIDGISTAGLVSQSASYSYNGGIATDENLTSHYKRATMSIIVPFTYFNVTITPSDFGDEKNAELLCDMFFETRKKLLDCVTLCRI